MSPQVICKPAVEQYQLMGAAQHAATSKCAEAYTADSNTHSKGVLHACTGLRGGQEDLLRVTAQSSIPSTCTATTSGFWAVVWDLTTVVSLPSSTW